MFFGEYQHKCDSKGRVMMPSKFREELSDTFYVTKGMEGCLFVFDEEEWTRLAGKINSMSQLSRKEARAFARLFYAGAGELKLDKQGRILIPSNLRQYADIKKDVYILGIAKRIEIWSKDRWEDYNASNFMDYDILSDQIMDLDI